MGHARSGRIGAVVLAVLMATAFPVLVSLARPASALTAHAPIAISGNGGFNATNGVVAGAGTAADPYVISGWAIDAPPVMGVQIRGTNAHVIIRDVVVTSAPTAGFYAYSVSNLTLSNVTALGGAGDGIRFESSRDDEVRGSNLTANAVGLVVLGSSNVSIFGTNLTANDADGITVSGSGAILIQGNQFEYNGATRGYGLDLVSSTNVTVRGNRFVGNDINLDGTAAAEFGSHTIAPDNLVSGLPILYLAGQSGLAISGLQLGELLLANCAGITVSNLTTSGGDLGIEVARSSAIVLGPDVEISDATVGLRIVSSTAVRVVESLVMNTGAGARIESSTDIRISATKISAPFSSATPDDGVIVVGSDRVNLTADIVRHHLNGVSVSDSGNISIFQNVLSIDVAGLSLESSWNLLAIGNLVSEIGTGVRADRVTNATFVRNAFEGAAVGANVSASSALRFVHNAFLGNHVSAYDANGSSDAWNGGYPTGGNFWSDYQGTDVFHGPAQNLPGSDGIGDTPFPFSVGAVDRYPLMADPVAADAPPEALFTVFPLLGTVRTTFALSANLSSDYEDALSRLQVRWSWESNGTWTAWTVDKYAARMFSAPGVHRIELEVRDRAGLMDNWTQAVLVEPKPDNLPPVVVTTPPGPVDMGQPIVVTANITDASGISNATIVYRGPGGGSFVSLPMFIEANGENFTATLPGQNHAGTLEYVIFANDSWANEARAPVTGVSTVTVRDTLTPFLIGFALAGGGSVAIVLVAVWVLLRRRGRARASPIPLSGKGPASPPDNP